MIEETTNRNAIVLDIDTRDVEEMRHAMLSTFGATQFQVKHRAGVFHGKGQFGSISSLSVGKCEYGSPCFTEFPEADFARLQVGCKGSSLTRVGQKAAMIDTRRGCVTSPGQISRLEFGENYEQLVLRIPRDKIRSKLSALLGFSIKNEIIFEASVSTETTALQRLIQLINICRDYSNRSSEQVPEPVAQDLQQTILVSFLYAIHSNASSFLESKVTDVPSSRVHMVESYIEANWQRSIAIEELVRLTGVSARSLARSFMKQRGYSPRSFAKLCRLRAANQMLKSPDVSTTVTGVSLACNFGNLGHFSRDYLNAFGEHPSATLRRARSA